LTMRVLIILNNCLGLLSSNRTNVYYKLFTYDVNLSFIIIIRSHIFWNDIIVIGISETYVILIQLPSFISHVYIYHQLIEIGWIHGSVFKCQLSPFVIPFFIFCYFSSQTHRRTASLSQIRYWVFSFESRSDKGSSLPLILIFNSFV
jgi:hypothetical protein